MIKYQTERYKPYITPVEITRETKHTVWLKDGSRYLKKTERISFFDTAEEAVSYLIEHTNGKIKYHERAVQEYQAIRGSIRKAGTKAKIRGRIRETGIKTQEAHID